MQRMADAKHNFIDREDIFGLPFSDLVTPSGLKNYEEHLALQTSLQGTDGSYLFDNDHSTKYCKGGPLLPCLVTHGTIVSEGKVLTSSEHLLAMGEPITKNDYQVDTDLKCYIQEGIDTLTPTIRKKVAGNAVCTDVQAAVAFYLMCNVSLKPPGEPYVPPPPSSQPSPAVPEGGRFPSLPHKRSSQCQDISSSSHQRHQPSASSGT